MAPWPLTLVLALIGLGLLYRFGPAHPLRPWRFISVGSATAVVLWMAVSRPFRPMSAPSPTTTALGGPLGAVVGLMMWLWPRP